MCLLKKAGTASLELPKVVVHGNDRVWLSSSGVRCFVSLLLGSLRPDGFSLLLVVGCGPCVRW